MRRAAAAAALVLAALGPAALAQSAAPRRGTRARYAALAALMLISLAAPAQARRLASGPFLVRIEGVLGARPPGPLPLATWKVGHGRDLYDLHVTKLTVLSGNIAYFNIIDRLEPYRPAFSIAGDEKAVQAFVNAPAGQPLIVMGYLRIDPAARVLMLSSVETAPAATPSPAVP